MNQFGLGAILPLRDGDGNVEVTRPFPHNIRFKANPLSEWQPWMYLPPTEATIKVLKRETHESIKQMKEDHRFAVKRVGSVFYGHCVYAFQFKDGSEIYLDQ